MQKNDFQIKHLWRSRAVFGLALAIVGYRWLSHTLLSQMEAPPVFFPQSEWIYRFFLQSGAPQLLTGNRTAAILFDLSLVLLPLLYIWHPRRIFAMLFTLAVICYYLCFNIVTGHHYHSLSGLMVITLPFWFIQEEKFELAWQFARLYLLYIFASAALWKIGRGSAFHGEQLSAILQAQQLDFMLQYPDSFRAELVRFLMVHKKLSHFILMGDVIVQGAFFIGFFTRRYDRILLFLFIWFCVINYLLMNIVSAELLIAGLTLLNEEDWLRLGRWRNRITSSSE